MVGEEGACAMKEVIEGKDAREGGAYLLEEGIGQI